MNKLLYEAATPENLQKSQDEDREYREFITDKVKNLPQNSKLKKHLAKLAFKKKTNTPLSYVDELMEDAIKKKLFPGAEDFSYLVNRKTPTDDDKRKALDEFIKKAQFEVVGTSRDLLNRCHFVSLSTANDHDKLYDKAEHASWEIFSIPITWDQQGGLWCFFIQDLVRYIGEHKHMDHIPFPGKHYIRKVMPHVSDYVPDHLHPDYIPHIHRWNESCQQLNHQIKSNHLSLEEINSIKELGPYLNITTILNKTHQHKDRHHIYDLLNTTTGGTSSKSSTSWTAPQPSRILVWISNMFDWIIQHRWIITVIRTIFCSINLFYFLGQIMRGTTDHRIWRIIIQSAFGSFLFNAYDALYSMGLRDHESITDMLSEVASMDTTIGFNFGRIFLFFIRAISPIWSFFRVLMTHTIKELYPATMFGCIWSKLIGGQDISKIRRDTFINIVMSVWDYVSDFIKKIAISTSIVYDLGTFSYSVYTSLLKLVCNVVFKCCKFIVNAARVYFGVATTKISNDLENEVNIRYDEYKGWGTKAFDEAVNMSGNAAAISLVTDAVIPGLGTTLAGADALRQVYRHGREMKNQQSSRINARAIDYAKSTYAAYHEMNETIPELNKHEFCEWFFGVLQKIGTLAGTIGMAVDAGVNAWFLQEYWDRQKDIQFFIRMRHSNPKYISPDEKLQKHMDGGYGCVSIYNMQYKEGLSSLELQEIHNPHERVRLVEMESAIRTSTQEQVSHNIPADEAVRQAYIQVLQPQPNGFTKNDSEMEKNFHLLSKYKGGQQLLLLASMSNTQIKGSNGLDMIAKHLPEEVNVFLRPFGGISLGSTMLYNMLEAGDGNYMHEVIGIHDKLYPIRSTNLKSLKTEFKDAQQQYVKTMLKDTLYNVNVGPGVKAVYEKAQRQILGKIFQGITSGMTWFAGAVVEGVSNLVEMP